MRPTDGATQAGRTVSGRLEKHLQRFVVRLFRPMSGTARFGLIESLGFGSAIDHWMRYAPVIEQIKAYAASSPVKRELSVLDVGGGPAGLASLLKGRGYRIIALDPDQDALRGNRALKVVGDGCQLPFDDRSVDIVVSVDSLEHVPAGRRLAFLSELGRVARGRLIIHCPIDSADRRFQATHYDRVFQRLHRKYFGQEEANTAEHLACGLPTVELVKAAFPEASVLGRQNGKIWLRHMMGGRQRWWRLVNGLHYVLALQSHDDEPPYHGALMVIDEPRSHAASDTEEPPESGVCGNGYAARASITAVVLAKNEERRIARCLSNLRWVDEVVVIDGQSADRTAEICRQLGARVMQRAFSGSFAEERNAGLDAATGSWVLQLDADDVVTPGMRRAVEAMLQHDDPGVDVYKFRRRSVFLGHALAYGAWTHYLPHLVRRSKARYVGRVHERPDVPEVRMGVLDGEVDHYFCEQFADYVGKLNRYSDLSAREFLESGQQLTSGDLWFKVVVRPIKLLWKVYVKKQGYRDGMYGLVMALQNSWSHVVNVAKTWERVGAARGPRADGTDPGVFTQQIAALNRESDRAASAMSESGLCLSERQLVGRLWLAPIGAFLVQYVGRGACRNGWAGVFAGALTAYGRFVTYVKYWERWERTDADHAREVG